MPPLGTPFKDLACERPELTVSDHTHAQNEKCRVVDDRLIIHTVTTVAAIPLRSVSARAGLGALFGVFLL